MGSSKVETDPQDFQVTD